MITYKIEPISGDNYRLEVNDSDSTLTRKICLSDIPGIVRSLSQMGCRAEKIEWHCIDR